MPRERIPSNYNRAREKMVQEQVIGRGIKDPRVIAAMRKVPREFFVESALAGHRTSMLFDKPAQQIARTRLTQARQTGNIQQIIL